MKGIFIVFEGGEGTGKSTQIKRLKETLEARKHKVHLTWEPGGTRLGEKIRNILLDPENKELSARCEALLYAGARAQHASEVLWPALRRGEIVLCDRYIDASRAYQGVGRNLGIAKIDEINLWGAEGLIPHRVYLFDVDPNIGLERAKVSASEKAFGGRLDRLEEEPMSFHEIVRQAYLYTARQNPSRYRIIDASQSIDVISQTLFKDVFELLDQKS